MSILSRLFKHELINGSFYIFIGSMFANFLAFLLNLFLARNLSYADYAIFASLLSIVTLASIPAGSINTIIVKFATEYFAEYHYDKLKNLYVNALKMISAISVFLVVLFTVFSFSLASYLHIDNIWYVIITGFIISIYYLNMLHTAFLQSMLKFGFISFMNAFGGIVKLLVGVGLVFLGFGALSGIWAIFAMTLGMFLVAFVPLMKVISARSSDNSIRLDTKEIFRYAVPTFVTMLFLTSFTSSDVLLVKHFFTSQVAGYYAGLSLIGRVIFYFTFPIPLVMFPLLVKRHKMGKSFLNLFYLALVLVLLPSVMISTVYFVFPSFIINLFLGGRDYLFVSKYLGIFGVYLTVFSLVNVCVNFFLSLNKTKVAYPVVLAAIMQVILIYAFHADFYQVIGVSLIDSFVLLVFLLLAILKSYGSFEKIKEAVIFLNTPTV